MACHQPSISFGVRPQTVFKMSVDRASAQKTVRLFDESIFEPKDRVTVILKML